MNKEVILSTEKTNLRLIKVLTNGIDLSLFDANPVMLLGHNTEKVIGKWLNVRKEQHETFGYILTGETEFDNDTLSQDIASKVDKGYIKGVSIAGDIIDAYVTEEDEKDILVVTKLLLKEVSITPLPANVEALILNDATVALSDRVSELQLSYGGETNLDSIIAKFSKKEVVVEKELTLEDIVIGVFGFSGDIKLTAVKSKLEELVVTKLAVELELSALKSKIKADELNSILDTAVQSGKIKVEDKDELLKLSSNDAENLNKLLNLIVKSPVIRLADKIVNEDVTVGNKTYDWYRKNDSAALKLMSVNEPIRFAKLKAEFLNS